MTGIRSDLAAMLAMALFPPDQSGPFMLRLPPGNAEKMRAEREERARFREDQRRKDAEHRKAEAEKLAQPLREERARRKLENWKKQHPHEQ